MSSSVLRTGWLSRIARPGFHTTGTVSNARSVHLRPRLRPKIQPISRLRLCNVSGCERLLTGGASVIHMNVHSTWKQVSMVPSFMIEFCAGIARDVGRVAHACACDTPSALLLTRVQHGTLLRNCLAQRFADCPSSRVASAFRDSALLPLARERQAQESHTPCSETNAMHLWERSEQQRL